MVNFSGCEGKMKSPSPRKLGQAALRKESSPSDQLRELVAASRLFCCFTVRVICWDTGDGCGITYPCSYLLWRLQVGGTDNVVGVV